MSRSTERTGPPANSKGEREFPLGAFGDGGVRAGREGEGIVRGDQKLTGRSRSLAIIRALVSATNGSLASFVTLSCSLPRISRTGERPAFVPSSGTRSRCPLQLQTYAPG